jgi:D-glycero-D-manno-heptose 1,7-bisphosphate phosphatase
VSKRAVFLDKDGTLVVDMPYSVDPARMELAPGAGRALRALTAAGYRLVVVSNQSGVARGLFREEDLQPVVERLGALLAGEGVALTDFVYCPHHPRGRVARYAHPCSCRKPEPGMIRSAAATHDIDLAGSWLVGDIEAGRRAGCRTVLLDSGNETEWIDGPLRRPDHVAADLEDAARAILSDGDPASLGGKR